MWKYGEKIEVMSKNTIKHCKIRFPIKANLLKGGGAKPRV